MNTPSNKTYTVNLYRGDGLWAYDRDNGEFRNLSAADALAKCTEYMETGAPSAKHVRAVITEETKRGWIMFDCNRHGKPGSEWYVTSDTQDEGLTIEGK